jgi:hypothetical protein
MNDADERSPERIQQDPVDIAHFDFHERFDQTCTLNLLTPEAKDRLGWVFDQTVRRAVERGLIDWETDEDRREFALDRVAEIADLAKGAMSNNVVTEPVLTLAAEKVIYYWQARCLKLAALHGIKRVFCDEYPD